jgi:Leucine-rich repeat (LRR) protein
MKIKKMSYNNNLKAEIKSGLLSHYDSIKSQMDVFGQSTLLSESIFNNKSEKEEFKKNYLKIIKTIDSICDCNMIEINNYFTNNSLENKETICRKIITKYCLFIDRTSIVKEDSFAVFLTFDWHLNENESNYVKATFESYFSNKNFEYTLNEEVLKLKHNIDKQWSLINKREVFNKMIIYLKIKRKKLNENFNSIEKLCLDFSYHERLSLKSIDSDLFLNLNYIKELSVSNFHFNEYFQTRSDKSNNILSYMKNLTNLEKLSLYSCDIDLRNQDIFKHLINLKELNITNSYFELINDNMLKGLKDLHYLNLSCNGITKFIGPFTDLKNLLVLDLSDNPIKRINSNSFNGLSKLNKLILSECPIEKIEEKSFSSLKCLTLLDGPIFFSTNCRQLKKYGIDRLKTRLETFDPNWNYILFNIY